MALCGYALARPLELVGHELRDLITLALDLRSLSASIKRDIERALQAKYMEVKAQQRKNRCSSDGVWSIWCAAKCGETER